MMMSFFFFPFFYSIDAEKVYTKNRHFVKKIPEKVGKTLLKSTATATTKRKTPEQKKNMYCYYIRIDFRVFLVKQIYRPL